MFAAASVGEPVLPEPKRSRADDGVEGEGEAAANTSPRYTEQQLMKEVVVLELGGKYKLQLQVDLSIVSSDKEGMAAPTAEEKEWKKRKKPVAFVLANWYHPHVALKEKAVLVGADLSASDVSSVQQAINRFVTECKDEEKVIEAIRALKPATLLLETAGRTVAYDYAPRPKSPTKIEEVASKATPKSQGTKK